jgi:hypothetical protein
LIFYYYYYYYYFIYIYIYEIFNQLRKTSIRNHLSLSSQITHRSIDKEAYKSSEEERISYRNLIQISHAEERAQQGEEEREAMRSIEFSFKEEMHGEETIYFWGKS